MISAVAVRSDRGGKFGRLGLVLLVLSFAVVATRPADAQLYINEIFWDAGGDSEGGGHLAGDDERDEFVELRGTPNTPLTDHYLIFLENEDSTDFMQLGDTGTIDGFFDLGSFSMGSNGFLMLRQKGNLYDSFYGGIAAGTTDLVQAGTGEGSQGWGNNFTHPGSSTVGFSWDTQDGRNQIENSGFTAMLINKGTGPTPTVGMKLDGLVNNDGAELVDGEDPTPHDGLDYPGEGQPGWTILDSIGVHSELFEAVYGRTYAQMNFGTLEEGFFLGGGMFFEPNIEPGATYAHATWTGLDVEPQSLIEREIEYIARWGNSTGDTEADWHVVNVTQRSVAGSEDGAPDYRVSGNPHPSDPEDPPPADQLLESSHGVPYGTPMLDTLGDPNYPLNTAPGGLPGDYNGDGSVDAADYTVWRDSEGSDTPLINDHGLGTPIASAHYELWRDNFGMTLGSGSGTGGGSATVPEPTSWSLAVLGLLALCLKRRQS